MATGPAMSNYVEHWPVTRRQAEIHAAMLAYQREHHGQGMTMREVVDRFGYSSTNAVTPHFRQLVRKGLAVKEGPVKRGRYVALPAPGHCPACGGRIEGGGQS